MDIGRSLRMILKNKGKTQQWLANEIGVESTIISKIANNKSNNLTYIKIIAKFFNMKVSEFIAIGENDS